MSRPGLTACSPAVGTGGTGAALCTVPAHRNGRLNSDTPAAFRPHEPVNPRLQPSMSAVIGWNGQTRCRSGSMTAGEGVPADTGPARPASGCARCPSRHAPCRCRVLPARGAGLPGPRRLAGPLPAHTKGQGLPALRGGPALDVGGGPTGLRWGACVAARRGPPGCGGPSRAGTRVGSALLGSPRGAFDRAAGAGTR
jgi:hypothetical protein